MGVAAHLRIQVDEYDARIRTFVPDYEQLIATVAESLRLLGSQSPTIVDLGIGTGALAARCLAVCPDAHLIGIDSDPAMLEFARARLLAFPDVDLVHASFLDFTLPPCDAIVACISLHHVTTPAAKKSLYAACSRALRPGGLLVSGDCFPAVDEGLARRQREAWLEHLARTYTRSEAEAYLAAWAAEDVYFALEHEAAWLREAAFATEVVWRAGGFAVLVGRR
jgi:tRNA (cmo5U34)-methyltransferase